MVKLLRWPTSRYVHAVLAVALATALRFPLASVLGKRQPFLTFYFALILCAWSGGLGPSLLAMILSALSASYFFMGPFGVERVIRTTNEAGLFTFFLLASTIIAFGEANRAIRRRLEREIVDREQAERKVRESEDQVRLLLDSTGEGIYSIDDQGLCTFCNHSCARMLGHDSPVALLGRNIHDLIHHTRADGSPYPADACSLSPNDTERSETHRLDEVFWRRDGTSFPVECRSSPIRRDGQTVGSVVTFIDISQRNWADQTISEQVRLAQFGRDIGKAMARGYGLREMLQNCVQVTVDRLDTAFARIWTTDETGQVLELQASAGIYTHIEGDHARIPVGKFKIGMIAQTRRPHLTNEVIGDPRVPQQEWARRLGMVAFAGYPLVVDDRMVGVLATFSRHPLSESAIEMMAGVANEIAVGIERKRAEERLNRHQEWFRVTLASIGDAVITTDIQSRVTFLNPVAERLTGWSLLEAAGQPLDQVFRIINEGTRQSVENPATRALRAGSIIGLANHTILIARDGDEHAIDDSAAPIREAGGEIIGAVLVFRDVTVTRAEQRSLAQSEERFRALITASSQIVWRTDPEGIITLDSPSWREFTGQTLEQWLGEGWLDAIHPDDQVRAVNRWKQSVHTGATYEIEYRVRYHDGSYHWTTGRGVPVLDEDGTIREWVGMNIDINESKLAEQALKTAKEEAERANEAKSQFLAVLSHELRTPLNPILLAASAMLERPADPDELRPTFQMIRNNVNLQARLIDDLLDVMRIARGKMPLHWEVADCHRLLHQAVQICQSEVYGKRLHLHVETNASLSIVSADPTRLQQVFWNLIKNAVKFTPEEGTIVVRTLNGTLTEPGETSVIVEVTDTGIGIEPNLLPRIFDPFQQGETTITRKFGGLGLGLAICKGIVEAHGGTLSVNSSGINQGTTFQVSLKVLPSATSEGSGETLIIHDAAELSNRATLKILVVEDEPTTLRLMARLLQRLGHSVKTASNITEGIETFGAGQFDLIISDIGLPDGSGLDLIRQAVVMRGPIPAIALTGFGMEEDIRRSREAGFTAHLTKPIDFTRLEAMIQQVTPVRSRKS